MRVGSTRSGGAHEGAVRDAAARRRPVHLLDTTMLYAPTSGGVARYLREKRAWLARHTSMRHTLIVPALQDGVGPHGEITIRTRPLVRSPYRWPYAASRWLREIRACQPDLIEAGDPGPLGWMALHAARTLDVPLISFCHAEVVRIEFDPEQVSYETLLRQFFRMHDPTQLNRQGPDIGDSYRSVIFYDGEEQLATAKKVRQEIQQGLGKPIVTQITPRAPFYEAEAYHQKFTERTGMGMCHIPYEPLAETTKA